MDQRVTHFFLGRLGVALPEYDFDGQDHDAEKGVSVVVVGQDVVSTPDEVAPGGSNGFKLDDETLGILTLMS